MNYYQNANLPILKRRLQFFRITKTVFFLLAVNLLYASATTYSQATKLNAQMTNATVKDVFKNIESQSEFRFFYDDALTFVNPKVNVNATNQTVESVLNEVLADSNLTYKMLDNNMIIIVPGNAMQGITVKGEVFDATNLPMPGVNIRIKGTATGVVTDINGGYTITVPSTDAVLQFSFIGYKAQEITVGEQKTINVTMEEETTQIEEVTVVAFGTARKRDLTGAVSSVDNKVLAAQSNSTVTRALEGAIPGLQVSSVDGQPGQDMGIRVRGLGSASESSANALIVIDGVPTMQSNALSSLNPRDIESTVVLKDAASTALYGSLGANGVVLITTKKGTKGKAKVTYDGRFGINQRGPGKYDKIYDPKDVYEFAWLSIYNAALYKSSDPLTTNVAKPNMTEEEAALFASQHLFNYTGTVNKDANGKDDRFNNKYQKNGLGNLMLYNVPDATYTPTGLTSAGAISQSTTSATMTDAYLVGLDGKLNPNARLLYQDQYDDYFIESKFRQEHNLSVSGASEKVDYFVSLGYLQDPSYIPGSKFNRYNVRANTNAQVYDWLKIGANVAYSQREMQSPATRYGRNPGNVVQNIFRWTDGNNPLTPVWARDEAGNIVYNTAGSKVFHSNAGNTYSPLGPTNGPSNSSPTAYYDLDYIFAHDKDITKYHDLNLRGYAEVKFLKDFTFTANVAGDNYFQVRDRYLNDLSGAAQNDGAMGQTYANAYGINMQQLLRWDKSIEKHNINVLLGHEFRWYRDQNLSYKGGTLLIPDFFSYANYVAFNTSSTFSNTGGNMSKKAEEGYFGRVSYNYDNKYYAEASLRRDGTSIFKLPENRWGTFWSVGAGWRISTEDFMAGAQSWLTDLKIRASYGLIGNATNIGNYIGYQTWGYGLSDRNYSGASWSAKTFSITRGNWTNDMLTWEEVATFDAGIDFRLWNRFYGTIDWYQRNTKNAIWNEPIAYSLGQSSLQMNTAELRNRGIELTLGVDIIKRQDLLWTFSVNGTSYKTTVVSVPESTGSEALGGDWIADAAGWNASGAGATSAGYYLRGVGKDYFNTYLYKYCGVDQNTGLPLFQATVSADDIAKHNANPTDVKYADIAGKKEGDIIQTKNYDIADRYEMGSAVPKFIGGFSTSVTYKGFDLMAMFAFQVGGKFLSVQYANHLYAENTSIGGQPSKDLLGHTWTPENKGAKFPMQMAYGPSYSNGATIGSWKYTDLAQFSASYLNVKNITFGYTLPASVTEKVSFIESARFYVSLDNMWLWTAQSGVDPRMSLIGGMEVTAFTYPYMRTMSLGVNLVF